MLTDIKFSKGQLPKTIHSGGFNGASLAGLLTKVGDSLVNFLHH